jgi:hypothetical protein
MTLESTQPLTAMSTRNVKITLVWDATLCILVESCQRFREAWCLHLQFGRVHSILYSENGVSRLRSNRLGKLETRHCLGLMLLSDSYQTPIKSSWPRFYTCVTIIKDMKQLVCHVHREK